MLLLVAVSGSATAELSPRSSAVWQDGPFFGIMGDPDQDDRFGHALASGDFNGDGRVDLAIGDLENGNRPTAGAVHVLYGSATGVSSLDAMVFDFDPITDLPDDEDGDRFGDAVVSGDFDADGFDDLVIGIPGEGDEWVGQGAILILYGSAAGVTHVRAVKRLTTAVGDQSFARFGESLAVGDFDGNGKDDLAVGSPRADVNGQDEAGLISIYMGTVGGLSGAARLYHQNSTDATGTMLEACEPFDQFGNALAAGDFDANGADDLAIGAFGESHHGESAAGVVHILRGLPGQGLTLANNQLWDQANNMTQEDVRTGDAFGWSLAVGGDMGDDGADDLLIGSPFEDVLVDGTTVVDAGAVTLMVGVPALGITTFVTETYYQEDFATGEVSQVGDYFGWALAVADFTGDHRADVAIGAPEENVVDPVTLQTWTRAGAVTVVAGLPTGLAAGTARLFAEEYGGQLGVLAVGDVYGTALAAGDFDGDGHSDLAVGVPGESATTGTGTHAAAGAVYVLYDTLFSDGFEAGSTALWSAKWP